MNEQFALHLTPMVAPAWLWALGGIGLILLAAAWRGRAPGLLWRAASLSLLLAALANPVAEHKQVQPVKDTALLVIDDSASQKLPGRKEQMAAALPSLRRQLQQSADLDFSEIRVRGRDATLLGGAMLQEMAGTPPERRAGVIILTDGAAHDIQELIPQLEQLGPVHVLLTGKPGEQDRRIELIAVPHYGLVGQKVTVKLRVIDQPSLRADSVLLRLRTLAGEERSVELRTGQETALDLPITHAGDNLFTLEADAPPDDLSPANNRTAIKITGVRERLRVLLVSGEPHPGERAWRNLLKADPAVDLVHFTILRPPQKQDNTPINQLSLIAFPVRELFEEKLRSFDLVIFDRFRKQGMLPMAYLDNIANYIEGGGAFLDASGPSYVTAQSLYQTPLARILPARPLGRLAAQRFVPRLTGAGRDHPVSMALGDAAQWGPWYRQTQTEALRGQMLLTGINDMPLLLLDRVGKGRVAQLLSDEIWLWARGHEGGGPNAELMRRLAHWLMQEPELEEGLLRLSATPREEGYDLHIARPGNQPKPEEAVSLTAPDGVEQQVQLAYNAAHRASEATVPVSDPGAYEVRHNGKNQIIIVGDPNAKELQDLRSTDAVLRPLAEATGSGIFRLADHPQGVTIERTSKNARQHGGDWLGLRRNGQTIVLGAQAEELLPAWFWVIAITAAILLGWRREGR